MLIIWFGRSFIIALLRAEVFRIAEPENREGNEAEEEEQDTESGALAEGLRELDAGIDEDRENENAEDGEQSDTVSQSDLAHVIGVQDGDQAVPSGNPGFHKDLPGACNGNDAQNQADDVHGRAVA